MEHICHYKINFNVNYPKRLFERFETLVKIEMHTREREKLFTFFSSDFVNFVLSVVNSFMTEAPII